MYVPQAFREDEVPTLRALMRQYSFATLITQHDDGPFASHLPLLVQEGTGPYGTLVGHMARANPQWRHFDTGKEALAIFQGPHAYVSPSWYGTHPSVPTWNYATVHAYGVPQCVDDPEAARALLNELVQTYEAPLPQPWTLERSGELVDNLIRAIVAFTMPITRFEGKYKLSQNRSLDDQHRVVAALQAQGDPIGSDVALLMRERLQAVALGSDHHQERRGE
jgi:transcriptional regulator